MKPPAGKAAPARRYPPARLALGALGVVLLAIAIAAIYYGPEVGRNDDGGSRQIDPPILTPTVEEFVNSFDGADCFFVVPTLVKKGEVEIEGYGNNLDAPLKGLDYEFKRLFKFEATIFVHEVTPEQCPAVNFLWRTRNQRGPIPRLDIGDAAVRGANPLAGTRSVKSGDEVTGTVTEFGNRNVDLLVVDYDG